MADHEAGPERKKKKKSLKKLAEGKIKELLLTQTALRP